MKLSRYGAHILLQNADPRKPQVAAAQIYFGVRARRAKVVAPSFDWTSLDSAAALVKAAQDVLAKAAAWDGLASGVGTYAVGDVAKMLCQIGIDTGRDRLFEFMHAIGWVFRQSGRWQARQRAVNAGRLTHMPQSHEHPEMGERTLAAPQVRVTMKGLNELRVALLPQVPALV